MIWPFGTSSPHAECLLIIGAHREELAFGEKVATRLDDAAVTLLRVANGVSARRPRPDELQAYLDAHESLYMTILDHVAPHHRLLIDLHCRCDETRAADILCADRAMLDHLKTALSDPSTNAGSADGLRFIQLLGEGDDAQIAVEDDGILYARPEIPEAVWALRKPLYLGIEVYLRDEGAGEPDRWDFAVELLEAIKKACRLYQRQQAEDV